MKKTTPKMKSIENVINSFPHTSLPKTDGTPTYERFSNLQVMLNTNSASVHSNGGDGMNGILIMMISTKTYQTISTTEFII